MKRKNISKFDKFYKNQYCNVHLVDLSINRASKSLISRLDCI